MAQNLYLQMITKFMALHEENLIKRNYKRAIWQFYSAYNISASIIDVHPNVHKKNKMLMSFIKSQDDINTKLFKRIQEDIRKDQYIIFRAIKMLEDNQDLTNLQVKEYPKGTIGVLAFEFE